MKQMRVGIVTIATWHATLLASLLLIGCHKSIWLAPYDGPGLPRKVKGTSDRGMLKLQRKLASCGVKVITIGSDYLVSIPAAQLFADQSPRLTWESYGLLNIVVCFLKQFRKVAITVTTYSSKYISVRREQALTLARSRAIADYLWSQGVDSRFIFTVGLGSDKPITTRTGGGDKSPNSRVEITFRDAII